MTTLDRIRSLAARQFGGVPETIDPDLPIVQLGADSLGYLEFLFELEDEFSVVIDQAAVKEIHTLRALAGLIDQLVGARAPQGA